MPKEVINNRWYNTHLRSHANCPGVNCLADCEGELVPASQTYTAVGWGKGHGDVQVGMVNPLGGDEHNDEQIWMDLDRFGINLLIRRLRKARDEAFGKDE